MIEQPGPVAPVSLQRNHQHDPWRSRL